MKRDSEFVTIDELCRKYKCGFLVIQRRIELLRERGLVDECRVRRVRSDGREYWCDGYKLR